jgi:ribonuclease VapC
MMAVDSSALLAIALDEPEAAACIAALAADNSVLISAGTMAETLIVAGQRNVGDEVSRLFEGLGMDVIAVTAASARRIARAYAQWGRGTSPAALNFGDCFAYEVAKQHDCPLLYVGEDFSRTDIRGVI